MGEKIREEERSFCFTYRLRKSFDFESLKFKVKQVWYNDCRVVISVLASERLTRHKRRNLVLDAVGDPDEVFSEKFTLQNLHDSHNLLSSNVHLILSVLSTCSLKKARLVCRNHVLESLGVLLVAL